MNNFFDIKKILLLDSYRYTNDLSFKSLLKLYLKDSGFRYVFWFRLCRIDNRLIALISRFKLFRMKQKFGIDVAWRTEIDSGFYIGHGQSIVISHTAKIGKNFNISQFCSIGSNHGQAATIGDNVYIGPNVCIVEDVYIADNSTIGAGSVVTRNVPINATVAGVPAKVLNFNNPAKYIKK